MYVPVWLSVGYAVSPAGRHQTKHLCVCVCVVGGGVVWGPGQLRLTHHPTNPTLTYQEEGGVILSAHRCGPCRSNALAGRSARCCFVPHTSEDALSSCTTTRGNGRRRSLKARRQVKECQPADILSGNCASVGSIPNLLPPEIQQAAPHSPPNHMYLQKMAKQWA